MTRRQFLLGTTALFSVLSLGTKPGNAQGSYPRVHEVTVVTPDIICVEIRDDPGVKGQIQLMSVADAHRPGTVAGPATDPNTGKSNYYVVLNPDRKVRHWLDYFPSAFLNRTAAYSTTGWSITGHTITAIYPKTVPWSQLYCYIRGSQFDAVSMAHYLHLQLDSALTSGEYTISFPPTTGLPDYRFTYDDKTTRCSALRATQHGHRRDDPEKRAYLSYWIPYRANEGVINYALSYGISKFFIIDSNGRPSFEGNIVQRIDPTTSEPTAAPLTYASTNHTRTLSGLTAGNPTVVTCLKHGFSGGESIRFRGVGIYGSNQWSKLLELGRTDVFAVTVVDEDRFTVNANSAGYWAYKPGQNLSGYDSLIDKISPNTGNRAATYVYECDYSSWRAPAFGQYRIYIPGLGVSDPFTVDDAIWYKAAANSCGGYYNQLTGIALDGRFGYTRPINYRPGQNGVTIYWSYLPGSFATEVGSAAASPQINSATGYPSTWISSTTEPEAWGGFHDAGDWDALLMDHAFGVYQLLMLGYVKLKQHHPIAAQTNFGFPKSTQILDPITYAGTDYLPDVVHQCLYFADWYRRCQQNDGRVPAGRGYENGGGGEWGWVPSCYSHYVSYVYASDEGNNYNFAALAAAIASLFFAEYAAHPSISNLQTLANTWLTAAENAWRWAESIYNDTDTGGPRDAYYTGMLDISTKARWSPSIYASAMKSVRGVATRPRLWAAAALFRATSLQNSSGIGNATYLSITDTNYTEGTGTHNQWTSAFGWEYSISDPTWRYSICGRNSGANAQHCAYIRSRWYLDEKLNGTIYNAEYRPSSYKTTCGTSSGVGYSSSGVLASVGTYILGLEGAFTDQTIKDRQLIALMCTQLFGHGANQLGFCTTTGLGVRNFRQVLVRDKEALGLVLPPPGFTTFTWFLIMGGGAQAFNWSSDSPVNWIVMTPAHDGHPNYGLQRTANPSIYQWPLWEASFDNSCMIYEREFQTETVIIGQEIVALWLHARDGNTAIEYSSRSFE
jgi:endoglucanase